MTYLFFTLAIIFNAVMDTLNDHFMVSIFKNLNPKFWNKEVSWKGKKFLGIVVLDAWHIAKYGMWIFIILSILTCHSINLFIGFIIYSLIWFLTFELFYSYIFKSRN